nr:MAG TPA: hypothetical protein [Caudoviricetes sp.]
MVLLSASLYSFLHQLCHTTSVNFAHAAQFLCVRRCAPGFPRPKRRARYAKQFRSLLLGYACIYPAAVKACLFLFLHIFTSHTLNLLDKLCNVVYFVIVML